MKEYVYNGGIKNSALEPGSVVKVGSSANDGWYYARWYGRHTLVREDSLKKYFTECPDGYEYSFGVSSDRAIDARSIKEEYVSHDNPLVIVRDLERGRAMTFLHHTIAAKLNCMGDEETAGRYREILYNKYEANFIVWIEDFTDADVEVLTRIVKKTKAAKWAPEHKKECTFFVCSPLTK